MKLIINLKQDNLQLKIIKNRQTIDPVVEIGKTRAKGSGKAAGNSNFHYGVDTETAKYYHDLSEVLTPLEVANIIKKGFIIKDGTAIYGELLTGLITSLDRLLKRNKIDLKSLKSYKILSDFGQDSTSYKIAAALVQGLKTRL